MDPHRWATIQATFDELVELDRANRASRLMELGSSDPELRAAVESLLTADAEASAGLAPLEAASDPLGLAGRTISHFQVLEPLGAGGMGVVYRGQDTRLGRPVALKFLLPHYSLDASAKVRFLREARAAAALDHPHLCTIYDVGESEDGRVFLAMALYAGETLKARLARDGPLPVAEALDITRQIASGLGCAHAGGIVHRDLKPGNVMLLPSGTVRILDFGLAKALDDPTSKTSAAFGTVAYMAPEQFRGESVDARADLWALGVLLYEMLTGQKPFAGEHEVAVAHAIVHAEPVAPATLRAGLPAAVQELVLTLLQKDLTLRYATVDDLIADLAAVGTIDESASPAGRTRLFHTRARRPAKRWIVSLAGVLLLGVVGGTAIARWLRPGSPRPMSWYSIPLPDTMGLVPWDIYRIAISPGGDRLVYVGGSPDGRTRLWLRTRDQLRISPLAGTERAVDPFFSRDGSRLGFVVLGTSPRSPTAVKVLSLEGGTPITVTDSLVDLGGAAWGYDGYIYFDGRLEGDGIARVRETGGLPEPVTLPDRAKGEAWHQQPEPLPNGKGVLFGISGGGALSQYRIGVVDLRTGTHRVLVRGVAPRYAASGHLVYVTATGTLMAAPFDQDKLELTGEAVALAGGVEVGAVGAVDLAISATGTIVYAAGPSVAGPRELVWVTREGKATPIDTAWRGADVSSLALSPDGADLAVAVHEGGATEVASDVWIKRLNRGPARKLTFEGDVNERPAWTSDGRAVTFVSNGRSRSNLNLDLYLALADGSAPPRMLRHEAAGIEEAEYSRDGTWLVYRMGFDLFAVRTDRDANPIRLTATPFMESTPRLSPDGRWLAYSSNESGRWEVYVRPFPNTGTTRWQVSAAGGAEPVWSRSGAELFYKYDDQLLAASVLPGATFGIRERHALFSVAGYENYFIKRTYDVSPDGKRFVMIRSPRKPPNELIVVENVFEELKARVKN